MARRDAPELSLRACVDVVLEHALQAVPGADGAAITASAPHGRYRTLGESGLYAVAFCEEQYRIGEGPVLSALERGTVVVPDLVDDGRWPAAGGALVAAGVRSVLCVRLETLEDGELGVLSLVAARPGAVTAADVPGARLTRLLVTTTLSALRTHEQVAQLEQAVRSNRDIGVAMGIVMAHRRVRRDEAFELLRAASQRSHRKLVDVADDVIRTGVLE